VSRDFQDFSAVPRSRIAEAERNGRILSNPQPSLSQWMLAALLFAATVLSASFAGIYYITGNLDFFRNALLALTHPVWLFLGLQFSIPLIAILLAHELGHYFACRHYGLHCTPPYFIPVPVFLAGTLGAFIKIRSPFGDNKQLFDVGIAGPLAGYAVTLPVLWIGLRLSTIVPNALVTPGHVYFGEPIIFRLIGALAVGYDPSRYEIAHHPAAVAGWFGLLVTSLNLLPIWQLDGGHISYAVAGPRIHRKISFCVLLLLALAGFLDLYTLQTPSYLAFGILILILGYRSRFHHPAPLNSLEPLGYGRRILAILALILLILSFTPTPVFFS
jgi:membrane-associated protease RseP (regulator of RpoE activity)